MQKCPGSGRPSRERAVDTFPGAPALAARGDPPLSRCVSPHHRHLESQSLILVIVTCVSHGPCPDSYASRAMSSAWPRSARSRPPARGPRLPRFWTQPRLSLRSPFPGMTPNRPRPKQSAPQCPRVTPALPPACCRSPPRVLAPTCVMLHGDNRSSDPLPAAGRPSQRVRVLGWTAG